MFRRRQPALIASLATLASVGLVVPGVSAGVPVQGASAASQAAAARFVAPAAAAVAVGAVAAPALADVAGAATSESAVETAADAEVVEEQVAEPAPEPVDESPTTAPDQEPAGDPTTETTTTTTTTTTNPAATEPTGPTTTTVPVDEPAGPTTTTVPVDEPAGDEPATDPTSTTTNPPVTEPTEPTEPTTTTVPVDEPAGDEPGTDPAATTTTTTTTTTTPADESACEPTPEPTTTTATPESADESACELTTEPPTTTTTPADAPDEEPAADPTTEPTVPTTVPAPVDNPGDDHVDAADDDDGATITPTDDEPSGAATVHETAQRVTEVDDDAPPATVDQPAAPSAPTPIDTTPAELNTYDPGLRASSYDGVYAEGVPVGVAMATTRWLESGNRYDAQARGSSASGAYQIIDSTWNGYGGYPRAVLAPPEVQDQFAYEAFAALLKRHQNDVSTIPVTWYIGHIPRVAEWDTVPKPEAGNVLTPRQYQAKWMKKFFSLLSEGAPVYLPSDTETLIPSIAFPVLGPVEFVDDWHFERDGGARRHEGLDMLGYEGQPIRAVFDGVITVIDDDPSGIAGNGLRLTRDDGLYANYFHLSDSETGPAHSSLEVGTRVRAGQIIGFMGSTGNAGIPHLHFELRTAEREPMAPYPAVMEAVQREQCTVGLGPWSTDFTSPAEKASAEAAALEALVDLTDEQIEGLPGLPEAAAEEVEHFTIEGPDGTQWVIGADGSVTATGQAAMIGTYQSDCPMPIETTDEHGGPIVFGTDAEGLPVDELPVGWWDDEAVEWAPDLDDEDNYVDPWELDQADLDLASENHVDHAIVDDRLTDRRSVEMI